MKNILIWVIAILLTIGVAYYQRKTGPTYPKEVKITLHEKKYAFKLLRSHGGEEDMPLRLIIPDTNVRGTVIFKRFPTAEPWDTLQLARRGDTLMTWLPHQPPAGKLAYRVLLDNAQQQVFLPAAQPVVVRFKGDVPLGILILHIFVMFFAMFFSVLAGLMAIWRNPAYKMYAWVTLVLLLLGGGLLGPLVQLHAFGALWTGIPFGWDLTDNKILIAMVFWLFACLAILRKDRYWAVILASFFLLLVYSIPHSMFGSQFNYETGDIIQGFLALPVLTGIRNFLPDRKNTGPDLL